jgi:hypothetical protein
MKKDGILFLKKNDQNFMEGKIGNFKKEGFLEMKMCKKLW